MKLNLNVAFNQKIARGIKAIDRTKDNVILSRMLIFPFSKNRKLQANPGMNIMNMVAPMDCKRSIKSMAILLVLEYIFEDDWMSRLFGAKI